MTRRPILVTGTHRSGTTWVGDMLALSPLAHYVHEPLAPMNRRTWLRDPVPTQYIHLPPGSQSDLAEDLRAIAGLHPPWSRMVARTGDPKHVVRVTQQALAAWRARRSGARAVIKDPFALLSAEWISDTSGADVVVLVRHPAAFVSSVCRLGWRLDPRHLLDQPSLVVGPLSDHLADLEADLRTPGDMVEHGCVVWRALNAVVRDYARRRPEWTVTPYEDLAGDPVHAYEGLFERLGLPWDGPTARRIGDRNAPRHGAEVASDSKGSTARDSRRAMWTWTDRLDPADVDRIRERTWDVARHWYADDEWWPAGSTEVTP